MHVIQKLPLENIDLSHKQNERHVIIKKTKKHLAKILSLSPYPKKQ